MYQYPKASHGTASSDRVKTAAYTHLGNVALRDVAVLGAGYSGEVKRVQDENGQLYALKVSNDKQIRFTLADIPIGSVDRCNMVLQEASEFEKLRKLFAAGVPVPRPHSFQIYANADGQGSTAVLMELVRGQTLRDWLSEQPGGKTDKLSGRSQHPAMTYADAIARVDVANCIIGALLKLRRLAFFADFKPRNIMIKEQRIDTERHFSACLVDIGGVVMYQDLSTEAAVRHTSCDRQPLLAFHPLRDRYLIETTCSYLSPEMALLIAEYDFWKRRLNNHFFRTRKELAGASDDIGAYQEMLASIPWGPGRRATKAEWKVPDLKVIISYLEARKEFERISVLKQTAKTANGSGSGTDAATADVMRKPSSDDLVHISEKSSVFTLGLILVELFGGKRTGLTSLTRLRHINDIFLGETGNAEFRMVMEWETHSALLSTQAHKAASHQSHPAKCCSCGGLSSTASTRCPNSALSAHLQLPTPIPEGLTPADMADSGATLAEVPTAASSLTGAVRQGSDISSLAAVVIGDTSDGSSADVRGAGSSSKACPACAAARPPTASYFEYYRQHAYPHEGLLSAWASSGAGSTKGSGMDCGVEVGRVAELSGMVQTLLDHCLRFSPDARPSLLELSAKLSELRRELIGSMLAATSESASRPAWSGARQSASSPWVSIASRGGNA